MRVSVLCAFLVCGACSEYGITPSLDETISPDDPVSHTIDPRSQLPQPVCSPNAPDRFEVAHLEDCRREPAIGAFDPVVEWTWSERRVEVPPVVANLDDDDGDGVVDENDVPDIVVTSFTGGEYGGLGSLDVIDGRTRTTSWSREKVLGHEVYALAGIAVADLEADGVMDILVTVQGGIARVDAYGRPQWFTPLPMKGGGVVTISIADMEGDGVAEIIVSGSVLNADGSIRWTHPEETGGRFPGSFAADVDGDGLMEVVLGGMLLEHDGSERWRRGLGGWPATVDLDLDGIPEFIQIKGAAVRAFDLDGDLLWTYSAGKGGGAPTVADFDGDGQPEIGYATKQHYRVLEPDGTLRWEVPVEDESSGFTSSAVFDFEPDGAAEVVYADERTLWVFDGSSGAVELELGEHNSGTRYEYPTIADVDNDGSAEILVPHGRAMGETSLRGFSIVGSATSSWAAARPIWNQHSYHATHINDDGTVPVEADANWDLYNTFRAGNSEVPLGLTTPDLTLGEPVACLDECYRDEVVWHVPVTNPGLAWAGPVQVEVRRVDTDELLFTAAVPRVEAGMMHWLGPFRSSRADFGTGGLRITVDPATGTGHGAVYECVEDNNERVWNAFPCA